MHSMPLNAADQRLATATLAALLVHGLIIFGLHFEWHTRKAPSPLLEITLAVSQSQQAPTKADFIAQSNQQGSGDQDQSQAIYSQLDSPYVGEQTQNVAQNQERQQQQQAQKLITQRASSDWQSSENPQLEPTDTIDVLTERYLSQDITSLQAHLDSLQNSYARMPRVKRLTAVSTQFADEAAYLLQWQQQVERTGNRFYPTKAKALGIEGDVRLMVAINPDGSVKEVRMLSSSGHTILDQAARSIVHLASPFKPFPLEIAKNADILEIIRTWQFRNDRLSSRVN